MQTVLSWVYNFCVNFSVGLYSSALCCRKRLRRGRSCHARKPPGRRSGKGLCEHLYRVFVLVQVGVPYKQTILQRGRTALDMAREKGHTAVIALFTSRLPPSAYVGSTTRSADVDADLATALSLSLQAPLAGNSAARREELETAVGCLATVDVPGKSQLAAMTILTLCRNALLHPSEVS